MDVSGKWMIKVSIFVSCATCIVPDLSITMHNCIFVFSFVALYIYMSCVCVGGWVDVYVCMCV